MCTGLLTLAEAAAVRRDRILGALAEAECKRREAEAAQAAREQQIARLVILRVAESEGIDLDPGWLVVQESAGYGDLRLARYRIYINFPDAPGALSSKNPPCAELRQRNVRTDWSRAELEDAQNYAANCRWLAYHEMRDRTGRHFETLTDAYLYIYEGLEAPQV